MDPLRELFGISALELFRKKELTVAHGPLERFPAFMREGPMESFDALSRHYTGPVEASQGNSEEGVQIPMPGAHSSVLLRLGLTVFFAELRQSLRGAEAWLQSLEGSLGLPECATLSAFANAPGSGLAVHHDRFDQLFFQIRGEKHFRYAPNGFVEAPDVQWSPFAASPPEWAQTYRHGYPLTSSELLERDFRTLELRPGSAFFLPAGTWHTTAEQTAEALSLVVAVRAPSRLEVLLNFLRYYAGQSPAWRARPYGAWSSDEAVARPEHAEFARLASELGKPFENLPSRDAFDALRAHGFSIGTQSSYPRGARFERYVRLPNSSVRFEDDAPAGRFRCIVSSGPTHRPQARTLVGFNLAARPVIEWVLEQRSAFTVAEAAERFPSFGRDDVLELFGWLSHAALIRPVPVPEWDAP